MICEKIDKKDPMYHWNEYENFFDSHYYKVGKELSDICKTYISKTDFDTLKFLELPSGFGRVTRHICEYIKKENLTVVDIDPEAIEFQKSFLNTNALLANTDDYKYDFLDEQSFDFALMGSLITHFNEEKSTKILQSFFNKLKVDSFAIITITGKRAYEIYSNTSDGIMGEIYLEDKKKLLSNYLDGKFGFCNYKQEHSFEKRTVELNNSYGLSMIPNEWIEEFCKTNNIIIIKCIIGGWDNHQDVYIMKKINKV